MSHCYSGTPVSRDIGVPSMLHDNRKSSYEDCEGVKVCLSNAATDEWFP
jgi:hypothetical protein